MEARLSAQAAITFGYMREIDRHCDEEVAERYLMGVLTEAEIGAVEEHLLVCHGCRVRFAKMEAYLSYMSSAALEIRRRGRFRLLAVVSGAVLFVILTLLASTYFGGQ